MHDEYYSIDIPGLFCRKFFLSVGRPRRPNENFHASPPMRAQDNLLCVVENYRCRSHVFYCDQRWTPMRAQGNLLRVMENYSGSPHVSIPRILLSVVSQDISWVPWFWTATGTIYSCDQRGETYDFTASHMFLL